MKSQALPTPTSSCWPMVPTAASATSSPRISSPRSICVPTSSPGWARPGRSTLSPSFSRRPNGVRSSPTPTTMKRAGLEGLDEKQSADRMAGIFGWFLEGHQLLTNRSMWRNFPMIRSKRWVKDSMVLLGDAKATAHFSIGSGTKLAMEDAIALADAMRHAPTVDAALQQYEQGRREEVEKTQHAADVSLVWFEHVDRFWEFDPVQFAFGVMTRAKAITYDNLMLRAPDFVAEVDKSFARQVRSKGFDVDIDKPDAPMFQPLRLREMELNNRAVVSPMCMYSAEDG